jgi:hypothetical protein
MVRPPDLRSADRLPTFSRHCLLSVSIDQLDKAPRSSRRRIYISFPCNASSHSPTASRGIPSPLQHPCVHRPTGPYYAARKRASPGLATNCACDAEPKLPRASCSPLLTPYHEPLRLHHRALQMLARAAGRFAPPTTRDTFLTALAKAALPPRVVAALDVSQHASSALRSPVSLDGLTFGLAGGGGGGAAPHPPGLSPRNLACLRALLAAALFLDGTPGSSWFAVLAVRQNADYLLTNTRYHLAWSGTPWHRRSYWYAEQAWQVEQQQLRHQVAPHPLLADVDFESVQAAIQRLFDESIMLDDSAFRDFVGVLCKLSSEMVSM